MGQRLIKNKGITLIALVITIIILLILAGVTIAMLSGENGILKQANQASFETKIATIKEVIELKQVEKQMDRTVTYIGTPYTDENPFGPITIWGYETVFGDGWYHLDQEDLKQLGVSNITEEYVVNYHNGYVLSALPIQKDGKIIYTTDKVSIKQVEAGFLHTLIVRSDGTLWGTGFNGYGQLGLGDTEDRFHFTQVKIGNVKEVYTGIYSTFIQKENGEVYACGENDYGQLGLDNKENQLTLTKIDMTEVEEIYPYWYHTFLKKMDGTVWACGKNSLSQLGKSTAGADVVTFQKIEISDVKSLATGSNYTVALKNDGTVWGTGINTMGWFGNTESGYTEFTKLAVENVEEIYSGGFSIWLKKKDQTLWGSGENKSGEIGTGSTSSSVTAFTKILDQVTDFKTEYRTSYAKTKDNQIYYWGKDFVNGTAISSPTKLETNNIKEYSVGANMAFIIKQDGSLWGMGIDSRGCLGIGEKKEYTEFTKIDFIKE